MNKYRDYKEIIILLDYKPDYIADGYELINFMQDSEGNLHSVLGKPKVWRYTEVSAYNVNEYTITGWEVVDTHIDSDDDMIYVLRKEYE